MAYNPLSAVQAITKYKNLYANATNDTERKAIAEDKTLASYYDELVKNGSGDIANQLHNTDYTGAGKIIDSYKTDGLQKTRDAVKNALARTNVGYDDNKFSYDDINQNVTYDGINFGKADYVSSQGSSYYNPDRIKTSINRYIADTGAVPNTSYGDMAKGEYGKAINTSDVLAEKSIKGYDPNSEQAKAIREQFKWQGGVAANNQIASGAADNGGNIDSFAAANASRQQKAFDTAGEEQARAEYRAWLADITNATNVKSGLGTQLFNNGQTENLNNAKINESNANITGYVPNAVSNSINPYFNPDGTLKNVDGIDYTAIINDPNTDPQTKIYAQQAKAMKVLLPMYSQYAGTAQFTAPEETAAVKQARATLKAQADALKSQTDLGYAGLGNQTGIALINADTQKTVAEAKPAKTDPNESYNTVVQDMTVNPQGNSLYFPLQQARDNYNDYVGAIGEDKLKQIVLNEAEKIAAAENKNLGNPTEEQVNAYAKKNGLSFEDANRKIIAEGAVSVDNVLSRYGFSRYIAK